MAEGMQAVLSENNFKTRVSKPNENVIRSL